MKDFKYLCCVFAGIVVLFSPAAARAQGLEQVGRVVAAEGQAFVQGRNMPVKPARVGLGIAEQTRLSTGKNGKMKVRMSDGYRLRKSHTNTWVNSPAWGRSTRPPGEPPRSRRSTPMLGATMRRW